MFTATKKALFSLLKTNNSRVSLPFSRRRSLPPSRVPDACRGSLSLLFSGLPGPQPSFSSVSEPLSVFDFRSAMASASDNFGLLSVDASFSVTLLFTGVVWCYFTASFHGFADKRFSWSWMWKGVRTNRVNLGGGILKGFFSVKYSAS